MINNRSHSAFLLPSQSALPDSSQHPAHAPQSDLTVQAPPPAPSRKRWRGGESSLQHRVERPFGSSSRRRSDAISPSPADERRAEKRQRTDIAATGKERHARQDAWEQSGRQEGSSSGLREQQDSGRVLAGMRRQREQGREQQSSARRARLDRSEARAETGAYRSRSPQRHAVRNAGLPAY